MQKAEIDRKLDRALAASKLSIIKSIRRIRGTS